MERIIFIGDGRLSLPFRRLDQLGHQVIAFEPEDAARDHSAAKASDLVIASVDTKRVKCFAEEIWHLLGGEAVISTTPDCDLSCLRDLCQPSKACRCEPVLDDDTDRSLLMLSPDMSFSEADLGSVQKLFGLGEILYLNQLLFDEVRSAARRDLASLPELIKRLVPRSDCLHEYLLGWVVYCLGQMALKGGELEGGLTQAISDRTSGV